MKPLIRTALVLLAVSLSGCIVVPSGYRHGGHGRYLAAAPVEPRVAAPGLGFKGEAHAPSGWGWRQPQRDGQRDGH